MLSSKETIIEEVGVLLGEYEQFLSEKAPGTREAYLRTARHLTEWVAQWPGHEGYFQPQQLTQTVVEGYLTHLEREGFSLNHRARVKSTISNFAQFLIEEKGLLRRNPTRGIELLSLPQLAPHELTEEQRSLLRSLVKQDGDRRGTALFALSYWAGCRVSELSWLKMEDTHVGAEGGWLHVGSQGNKERDIDLMKRAYKPLYAYLQATCDIARPYVFFSVRSERLTEVGIYSWFRTLKAQAIEEQTEMLQDLTFNDLRHDFASRARQAGWSLEEVAHYLGDVTRQGVPAMQSIIRSTPACREQIKAKLGAIRG